MNRTAGVSRGYARIAVDGAWHLWAPWAANDFYLIPACKRQLMFPRHGAKLKERAALSLGEAARICRDCEAKA